MSFEIPIGGDLTGLQAAFTKAVAEANTMGLDIARSLSKANQAALKLHAGVGGIGREAGGSMAKAAGGVGMLGRGIAALGPAIAAAAAALGGFAVARATIGGLTAAFDMGGQLSDLSARTGAAVEDLVVLRQAFADAGVGADAVGPMINRLQKAIAGVNEDGQPTGKVLKKLGINLGDLGKMGVMEQFAAIQKAISGITDPAQRSAAAMEIFGKSGGDMLALFADSGALSNAATNIGKQAQLLDKNAGNFDRISDLLGSASNKLRGFFVGMADRIAPVILPLLESFNKIDLSGFGQKVGDAFAMLAATFTSGQLTTMVSTSLKIGFMESVNFLWKNMNATWSSVFQLLVEGFKNGIAVIQIITTADFWKGMGNSIAGVFLSAVGVLLEGIGKAIELAKPLADLFGKGDAIDAAANSVKGAASGMYDRAGERFSAAGFQLEPAIQKIMERGAKTWESVIGKYMSVFTATGDVMDATELKKKLAEMFEEIRKSVDKQAEEAAKAAPKAKNKNMDEVVSQHVAPQVMSLARVGGGGYGGPNVMSGLYSEARQQTRILLSIKENTRGDKWRGSAVYA